MAQLVARLHGMEEVWGSNPHSSTNESRAAVRGWRGPPLSCFFAGCDHRNGRCDPEPHGPVSAERMAAAPLCEPGFR